MLTGFNAIRVLRAVYKLAFDDAKFLVDYARETGNADWPGIYVQYFSDTSTFAIC